MLLFTLFDHHQCAAMDLSSDVMEKIKNSRYYMNDFLEGLIQLKAVATRIRCHPPTMTLNEAIQTLFYYDDKHHELGFAALLYSTASCATASDFPRLRYVLIEIYDHILGKIYKCYIQTSVNPQDLYQIISITQLFENYVLTTNPKYDMPGVRHLLMGFIVLLRSPRAEWILTTKFDEFHTIKNLLKNMHAAYRTHISEGKQLPLNEFIRNLTSYEADILDSA